MSKKHAVTQADMNDHINVVLAAKSLSDLLETIDALGDHDNQRLHDATDFLHDALLDYAEVLKDHARILTDAFEASVID